MYRRDTIKILDGVSKHSQVGFVARGVAADGTTRGGRDVFTTLVPFGNKEVTRPLRLALASGVSRVFQSRGHLPWSHPKRDLPNLGTA